MIHPSEPRNGGTTTLLPSEQYRGRSAELSALGATLLPHHSLPGPPPVPYVGPFGRLIWFYRDPLAALQQLHQMYGELATFTPTATPWVCAFGPQYNQQILSDPAFAHTSPFVPGPSHSALTRLSRGLLTLNGPEHVLHRRLILPAFHKHALPAYYEPMVAHTQAMLDRWMIDQPIDLVAAMQHLTMEIACTTLLGVDAGIGTYIGRLIKQWLGTMESGYALVLPVNAPGFPYRRLLRQSNQLEEALRSLIAAKRSEQSHTPDVLALLLSVRDEDGRGLSDAELAGHLNLLFVAGQETSATGLVWTLFLLMQHPAMLADLVDELTSVLHGAVPTIDQLAELPLLDRVLKESLRLFPPAPYSMRVTTTPTALGPYLIPAGVQILISQYITHRLPDIWSDPLQFQPERWATLRPSPYAYLPFGAGARMCLGASFALTQMKVVLAMIVQRYRLTLPPSVRVDRFVRATLTPKHGLPVQVAPQDRQFRQTTVRGNVHEMVMLPG